MQLWQYRLLVTARLLYMFRTLSASIIRSTKNCSSSHWSWVGMIYIQYGCQGRLSLHYVIAYLFLNRLWYSGVTTDLGHPYWIYRVIHKSVKHFKNSQQIDYAMDHGNSYADRERNSPSFLKEKPAHIVALICR